MSKKTLIAICGGILIAALICLIVGICVYTIAAGTKIPADAKNFAELNTAKAKKTLFGMLLIIVGSACSLLPAVVLLVFLIMYIVSAIKAKKN